MLLILANFTKSWQILTKMRLQEQCKGVHCVDLGESFPTYIFLQNSASIRALSSLPALRVQIPQVLGHSGIRLDTARDVLVLAPGEAQVRQRCEDSFRHAAVSDYRARGGARGHRRERRHGACQFCSDATLGTCVFVRIVRLLFYYISFCI